MPCMPFVVPCWTAAAVEVLSTVDIPSDKRSNIFVFASWRVFLFFFYSLYSSSLFPLVAQCRQCTGTAVSPPQQGNDFKKAPKCRAISSHVAPCTAMSARSHKRQSTTAREHKRCGRSESPDAIRESTKKKEISADMGERYLSPSKPKEQTLLRRRRVGRGNNHRETEAKPE